MTQPPPWRETRFVLVRPRTPGNVGSVARAMKNFGFRDLVLVDPRLHQAHDRPGQEPAFERESRLTAWGAIDVLEGARRASSLEEALSGCGMALGTAPHAPQRARSTGPEEGILRLLDCPSPPPALVFGSESSGLTAEEISRLSGVIVIPTDPAYRDLNLAQTAVLLAYLLFRAGGDPGLPAAPGRADHSEVEAAADGMLGLALASGFLKDPGAPVARELRALFHRAGLTPRETGLLRSLWKRIGYRR